MMLGVGHVQTRFGDDEQQDAEGNSEGCDATAGRAGARLVCDFGKHVEAAEEGGCFGGEGGIRRLRRRHWGGWMGDGWVLGRGRGGGTLKGAEIFQMI